MEKERARKNSIQGNFSRNNLQYKDTRVRKGTEVELGEEVGLRDAEGAVHVDELLHDGRIDDGVEIAGENKDFLKININYRKRKDYYHK